MSKLALTLYTLTLAFGFFQFGAASVKPVTIYKPFAVETQVAMSQPLPDFVRKHRKDIAILSAQIPERALRQR